MIVDNQTMRIKRAADLCWESAFAVGKLADLLAQARSAASAITTWDLPMLPLKRHATCPRMSNSNGNGSARCSMSLMQEVKVNQFDSSRSTAIFRRAGMPGL